MEYANQFKYQLTKRFSPGINNNLSLHFIYIRNKNIKSVSLGFSKNKPVLRISSSTQVNSTLTDSVTTLLTKYISEHHKSQCDKNDLEKLIEISLEHPMQVAEFQGGIPGGEFIMKYDQRSWPSICTGLLYVKMDITMEGITKNYDAHVPILPFHCVLPAENENFRGKLPDLTQKPDIKVEFIDQQHVAEALLLKGKESNPHLTSTLLKATIFPEKATQEMQDMEKNGMHYCLVGKRLKGFLTGKAGLIRKTENTYIPVLVSSEIEIDIPPSAIPFHTHPCTLDVAACKFIIDYEQVRGCSFQEAFQTVPELHQFKYFGPPSKMDEAKGKVVVIQDGKMETLADNLFKIEFSMVKDGELLKFPCVQWKRDPSVDLEVRCGSPVFVLDAVSKSLHFLGGLYSRETAFHAAFALNIMKPAICHHLATQIIVAMKVEERDKLEILQKSRKESERKSIQKEIDSGRCLIKHVSKLQKRLDRLQKQQGIMNQQKFEQLLNRGLQGNISCTFEFCTEPHSQI